MGVSGDMRWLGSFTVLPPHYQSANAQYRPPPDGHQRLSYMKGEYSVISRAAIRVRSADNANIVTFHCEGMLDRQDTIRTGRR